MTAAGSWYDLWAGDQIGNLEYVIDEAALIQYRRVVGAGGCFPNLMAEDCRAMLDKRGVCEPLVTVWQRFDFLRPPIVGRRVQVGGWVREVSEKRGRPWLRTAAFAVDEIVTEILRSEAAFVIGSEAGHPQGDIDETEVNPVIGSLARSRAGDSGHFGELRLPDGEQCQDFHDPANVMTGFDLRPDGHGLTWITAGWLEGLMGADFGDDFRWGGRLSIAHHAAVNPGMRLRCDGVVLSHDIDASGVEARRVAMSVRDAGSRRVATAEATVKSPSPRLV